MLHGNNIRVDGVGCASVSRKWYSQYSASVPDIQTEVSFYLKQQGVSPELAR